MRTDSVILGVIRLGVVRIPQLSIQRVACQSEADNSHNAPLLCISDGLPAAIVLIQD